MHQFDQNNIFRSNLSEICVKFIEVHVLVIYTRKLYLKWLSKTMKREV